MDSVPSSAILLIVAIVVACLLAGFVFMTVQSQKENGSEALRKVEKLNAELDESEFTQYDGVEVTGSEVRTAYKMLKDSGVKFYLNNVGTEKKYTGFAMGTQGKDIESLGSLSLFENRGCNERNIIPLEINSEPKGVEGREYEVRKDACSYDKITKSATYRGSIHRDSTGAIDSVLFENITI